VAAAERSSRPWSRTQDILRRGTHALHPARTKKIRRRAASASDLAHSDEPGLTSDGRALRIASIHQVQGGSAARSAAGVAVSRYPRGGAALAVEISLRGAAGVPGPSVQASSADAHRALGHHQLMLRNTISRDAALITIEAPDNYQ
jgi:hypothetical protein